MPNFSWGYCFSISQYLKNGCFYFHLIICTYSIYLPIIIIIINSYNFIITEKSLSLLKSSFLIFYVRLGFQNNQFYIDALPLVLSYKLSFLIFYFGIILCFSIFNFIFRNPYSIFYCKFFIIGN